MTDDIEYWRKESEAAPSKELALVAFGAAVGLAKQETRMNAPRWIADTDRLVLTERQADGSYRDAYKMTPLPAPGTDIYDQPDDRGETPNRCF